MYFAGKIGSLGNDRGPVGCEYASWRNRGLFPSQCICWEVTLVNSQDYLKKSAIALLIKIVWTVDDC